MPATMAVQCNYTATAPASVTIQCNFDCLRGKATTLPNKRHVVHIDMGTRATLPIYSLFSASVRSMMQQKQKNHLLFLSLFNNSPRDLIDLPINHCECSYSCSFKTLTGAVHHLWIIMASVWVEQRWGVWTALKWTDRCTTWRGASVIFPKTCWVNLIVTAVKMSWLWWYWKSGLDSPQINVKPIPQCTQIDTNDTFNDVGP